MKLEYQDSDETNTNKILEFYWAEYSELLSMTFFE